jgi:hypothetical protein
VILFLSFSIEAAAALVDQRGGERVSEIPFLGDHRFLKGEGTRDADPGFFQKGGNILIIIII